MTVTFHPASDTSRLLAAHAVIRIESLLELLGPEGKRTNYFEAEGTAYDSTQRNVTEDFSLHSSSICSLFFPFIGLKIQLLRPSQNIPRYNTLALADRCENVCQMCFWVFIFMCRLAIFGSFIGFDESKILPDRVWCRNRPDLLGCPYAVEVIPRGGWETSFNRRTSVSTP
jgi:hypothetical protein